MQSLVITDLGRLAAFRSSYITYSIIVSVRAGKREDAGRGDTQVAIASRWLKIWV